MGWFLGVSLTKDHLRLWGGGKTGTGETDPYEL